MSLKCGSTIYFANLLSPGVPSVASGNGRAQPNSSWCGRAGRVPPSLTTVRVPSKNSAVAIVLRFADRSAIRPVMARWLGILLGTLRSTVRTKRELALENLALRQQLAVWKARQPRPRLTAMDGIFLGAVEALEEVADDRHTMSKHECTGPRHYPARFGLDHG